MLSARDLTLRRGPQPLFEQVNFTAIDGYRATARAAAIMHGLGFQTKDHERTVAEFSGGWRVRLAMARALCSRAELLLLDEPTNHLDLDAIIWLEDWLKAFPGTLLMISHDREFLDAVIDRVLHIENRTINAYSGNYSQFEQKRAEELALQRVLHARQIKRVAEITSFVNRFRASATKSRQAQSRLKMLERMERIVPAHVDSLFEFEFTTPLKTPRPLLTLEDAACGYAATRILAGINLSIGPQDRIALLGPNGAGKSTLTKMLAGCAAPLAGKRIAAASAPKRGRLGGLRREFEQIEKGIIAIEAERTLIEAELCKDPMHGGLQARHAALTREAASMESRWMEVGTAIEEAEAADAQSQD